MIDDDDPMSAQGRQMTATHDSAMHALLEEAFALARSRSALNAFITLTPGRARRDAARLASRSGAASGGLPGAGIEGWTVAVKDLIDVAGVPTTAGGKRSVVAGADAPLVGRLRRAGALVMGKSNMDEWGLSASGRNDTWGDCRNPHDERRLAGGSSGGSAAAVAAGICRLGLGTDTAGSLRVPAAFCGVTALKPGPDSVDRRGVLGLAPTLDSVGPIARSAADCAAAFQVLDTQSAAGRHGWGAGRADRWAIRSLRGRRLGIARGEHWQSLDEDVGTAIETALRSLEAAGTRLVEVEVPLIDEATRLTDVVLLYELARRHGARWRRERAHLAPHVVRQLDGAVAVTPGEYRSALAFRTTWLARLGGLFDDVDALFHATTSSVAPEASARARTSDLTRLSRAWNLAGTAVLALPCGRSRGSLPISASIVGPPGGVWPEEVVLRFGQAYQQRTEWHR